MLLVYDNGNANIYNFGSLEISEHLDWTLFIRCLVVGHISRVVGDDLNCIPRDDDLDESSVICDNLLNLVLIVLI